MEKTLEHLKETLEDEIKKVIKKGDITPSEMESIQSAVCTIETIKKIENGNYSEGMMNGDSYGWNTRNMPYTHMPSYDSYGHDSYGNYSERYYNDGNSYRRGRSPVTGRYISRGRGAYDDGYSGHSIKDRMVARLESMMDEAQTEHERQTVSEWINRLSNQ